MVFPFGTNVSNILGYCHGSQGRQVSSINAPTFTSDMKFQSKMPLRPNASAAHHRFREDARAPQVFGIGRIEPFLGIGAPTILCDFPASMAALSRRNPADSRLAERLELYVCGLELANAFGELTDPAEQRARFLADQAKKPALYGETYPIDEDFLAALEYGLPPSAGIALGFDRLVMLATAAHDIEDVLWAPVR